MLSDKRVSTGSSEFFEVPFGTLNTSHCTNRDDGKLLSLVSSMSQPSSVGVAVGTQEPELLVIHVVLAIDHLRSR